MFGGIIEAGETPEQALVREIKEELGIELKKNYRKFKNYESNQIEKPNTKYVFYARTNHVPEELTLHEGQELRSIDLNDRHQYKFANILGSVIDDFLTAWIKIE